jgi:hypothetical protein
MKKSEVLESLKAKGAVYTNMVNMRKYIIGHLCNASNELGDILPEYYVNQEDGISAHRFIANGHNLVVNISDASPGLKVSYNFVMGAKHIAIAEFKVDEGANISQIDIDLRHGLNLNGVKFSVDNFDELHLLLLDHIL